MSFLIVASYLPSVLNFRGKLLEAIASKNIQVHVACPDTAEFAEEKQRILQLGYVLHDIPMQRTGMNPLADLKTLLALYRLMNKIRPDVVLAYTIKPVIYGMWAAYLARVPQRFALITGLGYAFQNVEAVGQRSMFQRMVHGLYAQALKYAHKVFFQNPDDLALFQDLQLIQNTIPTVVVNGSGVDTHAFPVVALPQTTMQQPKISFLMIARLLADKGVREYAEAARQIKQQYPEAEFHLVGWIDDNPHAIAPSELESWVANGDLNYWGKLSDVQPAIAASSVYVLPSYREGTPRTVLEAMAMGRAIITTDAPGCRETVINGENGFLVPVKSVEDLVQVMQTFIQQPELTKSMGQKSREMAVTKYDVHQVNAHMLSEMNII